MRAVAALIFAVLGIAVLFDLGEGIGKLFL
jgi:hypothetical protein